MTLNEENTETTADDGPGVGGSEQEVLPARAAGHCQLGRPVAGMIGGLGWVER
ncbi:MAG TPA: hypothetical protein VIY28_10670 [Pseudonocardiaceae bacterium]